MNQNYKKLFSVFLRFLFENEAHSDQYQCENFMTLNLSGPFQKGEKYNLMAVTQNQNIVLITFLYQAGNYDWFLALNVLKSG